MLEAAPIVMQSQIERIGSALGFSLEEIALNRAGQVSSHQWWQSVMAAAGMSAMALVALGLLVIILFVVKPSGAARVAFLFLGAGSAALTGFLAWQTVAAAISQRVAVAQGPLELKAAVRRSVAIVIGDYRRTVSRAADVLTPGKHYRVYYLEPSKDFLSIEPIEPTPAAESTR